MTITIRLPASLPEIQMIEWLQAEIWGNFDVTPVHVLLTMAQEANGVLIAFDDHNPVGFAYGFPAFTATKQLKFASHQVGVLPSYQDSGLGYRLKLAQRDAALAQGFNLITWTFDPLQSRNARLNLGKLGAVCRTYIPNHYGEMTDELNKGLPSDRFKVEWWITSPHVARRLASDDKAITGPILNQASLNNQGFLQPPASFNLPSGQACLVEIPINIATLKQHAPEIARQWRFQTRAIFEAAFKNGYFATNFIRQEARSYYLLEQNWQPNAAGAERGA